MTSPTKAPQLFPEAVPGGSLIGSVNSRFAITAYGICGPDPATGGDKGADGYPQSTVCSPDQSFGYDFAAIVENLSRTEIEALVTRAWIRSIPNQSNEKLRDLVTGSLRRGILTEDDIHTFSPCPFTRLPIEVISLSLQVDSSFKFRLFCISRYVSGSCSSLVSANNSRISRVDLNCGDTWIFKCHFEIHSLP
jgi:hypothetical protein